MRTPYHRREDPIADFLPVLCTANGWLIHLPDDDCFTPSTCINWEGGWYQFSDVFHFTNASKFPDDPHHRNRWSPIPGCTCTTCFALRLERVERELERGRFLSST